MLRIAVIHFLHVNVHVYTYLFQCTIIQKAFDNFGNVFSIDVRKLQNSYHRYDIIDIR